MKANYKITDLDQLDILAQFIENHSVRADGSINEKSLEMAKGIPAAIHTYNGHAAPKQAKWLVDNFVHHSMKGLCPPALPEGLEDLLSELYPNFNKTRTLTLEDRLNADTSAAIQEARQDNLLEVVRDAVQQLTKIASILNERLK